MGTVMLSAPQVGISFEVWQSGVVLAVSAIAAVLAHYALAVFNDGARPFMLDFIQGRTSRAATATIIFGLSAGFIFGLGAPMALSTGVLNPWLIFLPAEILGLIAPWPWLAAALGLSWGAICAFGLSTVNNAAQQLPIDFITALQQIGTPILWLFAMFPVIAVAQQFGKMRGAITFGVEAVAIVATMKLWPTMFAGAIAMALGVAMLLAFALTKDRTRRAAEQRELASQGAEAIDAARASKAAEAEAVDQLFGPNAERLRRGLPWLAILGAGVAALSATHVFAGGEATSFLIADGNVTEAAQVDFYRAFGFIPLIATTALASGAYAMAGFTFVYPVGYLTGHWVDNPVLAIAIAAVLGAAIFAVEVFALSALGRWLQHWPSVRDSADHIRNAIHESLHLAILVGSLMAALAMGGGLGVFIVGGLYLLNDAMGRPVVRMAAGPAAVIIGGVVLNLLYLVDLFAPVAA
ncbi:YhfT family protein [Georgenia sp. Z1491]|uniref:YhfT family protein n=1 Tax=Georgenia sp. Z1491 TaxID=3416707 RepID=UPI003CEB2B98